MQPSLSPDNRLIVSGSHPVAHAPNMRERMERARTQIATAAGDGTGAAAIPSAGAAIGAPATALLTSDRVNYLVGERPTYELSNAAPNQPVGWIVKREGRPPMPVSVAGQITDASGHWSGMGDPWTAEQTGFYTITAQAGNATARRCFTVIGDFGPPSGKTAADLIGVTHVAGDYRFAGPGTPFGDVPFLVEGAQRILNLGARRGFFYLSPQFKTTDYPFDDFGPGSIKTLVELAKSPPYRQLFKHPFEEFVLTTYTFANWNWALDRAKGLQTVPFAANAETAEIADLVAHLASEYPDRNFVIKNWEGDWQVQENFDLLGVPSPERIAEFVAWMKARHAGVVQGRANARSADAIQHAIEFNLLGHSVRDSPCVLRDVIRQVESDLISYSSWETCSLFDTRRMKDAIAFAQRSPGVGGRKLMIAEFGVANDPPDADARARTEALLQAFVEMGVHAFVWEIYNNTVPLGLIRPDFGHSDTWAALREALGSHNQSSLVQDSALTEVPASIPPGQTVPIRLTFKNTGQTWYRSVGYEIELIGPGETNFGDRAGLSEDVPSAGQTTFAFDFTAPQQAGDYRFQMAQHGIELFGESISFQVGT